MPRAATRLWVKGHGASRIVQCDSFMILTDQLFSPSLLIYNTLFFSSGDVFLTELASYVVQIGNTEAVGDIACVSLYPKLWKTAAL